MTQASRAGVIYQDNFVRSGELNGSSPAPTDTPVTTYTSTAGAFSTGSNAATAILTKPGTFSGYSAFLPLTITGTNTYTYSITLTPNGGTTTDWLAAGLSASAGTGSAFYQSGVNGELWVLYRDNGQVQSFFGGGTSNSETEGTASTPGSADTFTFTIAPTTGAFTISDSLGLINRAGALTPAQVSAINFAGFGNYQTELGSFSSVAVSTASAVPEPASCGMVAIGVVGLLARRRSRNA